jgi:hypothetical protein
MEVNFYKKPQTNFAGPLLDFFPAFFAEFGSNGMSTKF